MAYTDTRTSHVHLDFNEVNIITENRMLKDRSSFMQRLSELEEHTSDPYLVRCLESLTGKLSLLSDEEFKILIRDAENGDLMFPANYALPNISELSL